MCLADSIEEYFPELQERGVPIQALRKHMAQGDVEAARRLAASIEGNSVVRNADPIRRAHPYFAENLRKLGADIEWDE